ncbi:MAG: hypothetical protein HOP11_13570 [Saprospiraceae bacterium]|nr:hypothetical protein [Saprospiraceae bacterium]
MEGKWYVIYGLGTFSFIGLQTPIIDPNFLECGTSNSPPSQIKRKNLIGKSEDIKMSHMIMPGSPCEISILFLFTAKSGKFGNDDRQDCKRIVDEINIILANSEIDNVKVAFAGIEEIPSNEYTEPSSVNLNHVVDWALSSSWVQSKRGFYAADIVMIMSEVDDNSFAGVSNGQQGNPNPTKEAGIIALDRSSNGFGNYTPAHELGHSIGCRHQTCNVDPYTCDNNDPYIHPHTFGVRKCWLCSWKNKMTLMHPHTNTTILNEIKRIGYFSNPDVHLEGTNDPATGIVDQRDNSRWIKDVACKIANFENGLAHLSTSISGKSSICYLYTTDLQVKVTGSNNYTVQYWEEIYNGASKIFPGNNLSHTFNQAPDNYLPGSSVQVQVNVLIDNAYTFLSKFTISIKGNCQLGDPGNGNLKKMDKMQANASLPIQDLINEVIRDKEEVGITIYNLSMQQIIQEEKLKDSKEVYEVISLLPRGIYICIIKSSNSHYARKIFIP